MAERIHGPTIPDTETPLTPEVSDFDKETINLLKKKISAFNRLRETRHLEIKINVAYLCNHQNVRIVNKQLVPLTDGRATAVIANKIFPAVVNDIAVSSKTSPTFDIVPAGTDEDDKATAKAGEKIVPYLQRINDPHLHRKSVVLWYDIAGSGWRKVYWNPNYKVTGRNPLPGEEGHNPELAPMAPIFQGEVIVEHVPNTELIYDWRQKNLEKLKWIIHHKTITYADAKSRVGDDVVIPLGALHTKNEGQNTFESEVMGQLATLSESLVGETPDPKESDLIDSDKLINYYEFWHVPDKNMPQGAYVVGLGDIDTSNFVLAENRPYPIEQYPHKELIFIPADPLSLDGITVGAVSRISLARPLQREYNKVRSLIEDNIDALGSGVIFTPRGANIDHKKVVNVPHVLEYDGIFKPTREGGVQLAGGIFAYLETIRKDIDEIFAFHEPSKGIMPEGGPRSAIGLQTLQEADATQLSPMINGLDESDERIVHQMLSLAIANYGERLIQIVGKDNQWVTEKISAEELNGKVNVIVRTGSSLPLNKTLEQEKTVFAWQSGLLGHPQDPNIRQKVIKAMDLGGFDQILQDSAKHTNFAQREFIEAEKLAMQMPPILPDMSNDEIKELINQFVYVPPVNDFDDHYVHENEHSNTLLSKYYEYIGSGQPHLQILAMAMRDHLNMHKQAIYLQQLAMLQMQDPKSYQEEKKEKK